MYEVIDMKDNTFAVLETETSQLIAKGISLSEAEQLTEKLNKGSGFEGKTPSFLTEGDYNGC